ncbi:hypothetical protein [Saezia sanguinis]|uniref:hypothetical protein n=1 Tax=Saezia sanguinis TaxID=1965230 RepID=UPI003034E71D
MRFSLSQPGIWVCAFFFVLLTGSAHASAETPQACVATAQTPLAKMECFRGLPYRADGALDEHGRWTSWADQSQEFASAGLNCSGLTTAISRAIWGQALPLNEAKRDRLGDSGPEAPMGEDWDFGIDLILNLTDGLPRQLIPNPYANQNVDSHLWNALDLRGVDVDSSDFAAILSRLQADRIYYFAISKPDGRFKGGISFYHVGLILKDGQNIWMYHATEKGGVYRVNLAGESGLAWFRRYYGASPRGPRHIQLVEVPLTAG